MPRNTTVSGLLPFVAIVAGLAWLPLQFVSKAQEQAPAAAVGGGGRAGGPGGRGGGPTRPPSALRAIPAEATAAKAKDPGWQAPRSQGDTLVVETTNFTDKTSFSGLHSDRLKLTERFTRIDPQMIDYRIRVEDPATWTAPFTVRLTITHQPNYQLYECSCHEGNGAVGYALSGERAYERMVADATAKGLPIPPRTMGMEVYSGAAVEGRQPIGEVGGGK